MSFTNLYLVGSAIVILWLGLRLWRTRPRTTMPGRTYCNIQHRHAGCRCVRSRGHEGNCWSSAERSSCGAITRCVWQSSRGEFKSHVGYELTFPSAPQAKRGGC